MERIIETDILSLDYEPILSLLIERWYGCITNENYKKNMSLLVEKIFLLTPQKIMVYPNYNFLINPDLQEWMAKNVFEPTKKNQAEKIAFFMPEDKKETLLIQILAVIRIMEDEKSTYQIQYFYDEDEAYKWLLL